MSKVLISTVLMGMLILFTPSEAKLNIHNPVILDKVHILETSLDEFELMAASTGCFAIATPPPRKWIHAFLPSLWEESQGEEPQYNLCMCYGCPCHPMIDVPRKIK